METALPLKTIFIIIALAGTMAICVIIFAKRQITRFALKSSRHVPITAGVPKYLRQEIERRLKRTTEIKYEPVLFTQAAERTIENTFNGETCHFRYRMKAVDAMKKLDVELSRYSPHIQRHPDTPLRLFLLEQRHHGGPLTNVPVDAIDSLVAAYDHARHEPAEFLQEEYDQYIQHLNVLVESVRNKRNEENRGQQPSPTDTTSSSHDDKDSGIQVTFRPAAAAAARPARPSPAHAHARAADIRLTPTGRDETPL